MLSQVCKRCPFFCWNYAKKPQCLHFNYNCLFETFYRKQMSLEVTYLSNTTFLSRSVWKLATRATKMEHTFVCIVKDWYFGLILDVIKSIWSWEVGPRWTLKRVTAVRSYLKLQDAENGRNMPQNLPRRKICQNLGWRTTHPRVPSPQGITKLTVTWSIITVQEADSTQQKQMTSCKFYRNVHELR